MLRKHIFSIFRLTWVWNSCKINGQNLERGGNSQVTKEFKVSDYVGMKCIGGDGIAVQIWGQSNGYDNQGKIFRSNK